MKCLCYDVQILKRAISSVVERLPYKQDVTGSSPVSPILITSNKVLKNSFKIIQYNNSKRIF